MSQKIPYPSLWKTALFTAPLLVIGFMGPVMIVAGYRWENLGMVLPGGLGICGLAWSLNIGFLRFRERLGRWKWVQILVIGGLMITVSFVAFALFGHLLPPQAERLAAVRYVNAFALNAIIYTIIDLRLLSDERARLAEENADLRLSQLETQYQILKDQVNPHFLFNALGTIKSLARRDPALTEAYIIRLSEFLRATLQGNRDLVPLQDELRLVLDFVELQKMRFHDALVFDCPAELQTAPYQLPYFSVLTLVENAVKHNAMAPDAPLIIRISLLQGRLQVWNNRQIKALHSPSNGSGIANLQKRCRILGNGEITIDEAATHYAVTIPLLPL